MDEKLMKQLGEQTAAQIKEKMSEMEGSTVKQIDTLKAEITELMKPHLTTDSEFVKNLQTQVDELSAKLKKQNDPANMPTFKGFFDKYKDNFTKIKSKELQRFSAKMDLRMFMKAAGDILVGDYDGSENFDGDMGASLLEPGVARIAKRQPFIREISNVIPTTKPHVYWTETEAIDANAAGYAEGASPSASDMKWIERSASLEKVGHFSKVSRESLDDYDYVMGELRSMLNEELSKELDRQLVNGNATGTDVLNGVIQSARDFDADSIGMENKVKKANRFDSIRFSIAQIAEKHFVPNYVVMRPADAAMFDATKDDNGAYVLPPFEVNGNQIAGVQIIQNTGVAAGHFLVGDFNRHTIRMSRDLEFEMFTQNEDDALKELVTMKVSSRLVNYIKENHRDAFIYNSFENAINQLDKTKEPATTS